MLKTREFNVIFRSLRESISLECILKPSLFLAVARMASLVVNPFSMDFKKRTEACQANGPKFCEK